MAEGFTFETGRVENGAGGTEGGQGEIPGTVGANGGGIGSINSGGSANADASNPIPKRRGRKPLPRDAAGNIIRDGSQAQAQAKTGNASGKAKESVAVEGDFIPNDRQKLIMNIQGIHQAAAILTKQPVLMLTPDESNALGSALADVLDLHKINITSAGGNIGLYFTLVITVMGIYKPRLTVLRNGGGVQVEHAARPATPGDAAQADMVRRTGMDFGPDVQPSVGEAILN